MNEYRIFLTGDEASVWRRLVGRYYWLPDSQIITHLLEVHRLSCKDYCSLDRFKVDLRFEDADPSPVEETADLLVKETVSQQRSCGLPDKNSCGRTTQTLEAMEVTWDLVDSTTQTDTQGFVERSASQMVRTSLTRVESELPGTIQGNTEVLGPELANPGNLPIFSQTSSSHGVKVQKMVPSGVDETDLSRNSKSVTDGNTSNIRQNLQSTPCKQDHQSTSAIRPFSPVIVRVESLANDGNEENPPLHQSSSMEVLANSKPIMFLVKNRHNKTRMGIIDKEQENPESGNFESEQWSNMRLPYTANDHQSEMVSNGGSVEPLGASPPCVVDQSDTSDPGYRSAEVSKDSNHMFGEDQSDSTNHDNRSANAQHQPSQQVYNTSTSKTTVSLEFGTKYDDTKAKERKENKSDENLEEKRVPIKKPDRFCVYCQKIVRGGKLRKHISHTHKLEPEVQAILKKPVSMRMKFFIKKRREGIYQYNLLSVNGGRNQPLMRERKGIHSDNPIKVCSDCKGFFSKSCFFKHKCVSDEISAESRRLVNNFTENMDEDVEFQNILSGFVHGEIDEFCKTNNLIKTIGYQYYNSHRRKKGKEEEARRTTITDMRELSRLFFQFRIISITGKAVEDMFDRDNLKELMEAVKLLETLTESGQSTKTGPTLHNVVSRSVKSLEDFYTQTMQFKMKKELRKFKLAYTKIKPKAITRKSEQRKESAVLSESSNETAVEKEIGEDYNWSNLVMEETGTEQSTCNYASKKKLAKKAETEEETVGTFCSKTQVSDDRTKRKTSDGERGTTSSTFNNTSSRKSALTQVFEEASRDDCPSDDTSRRKSAGKPVNVEDTTNGISTKTSSRKAAQTQDFEEASNDDCPSDDTSRRKSARKPVPKPFHEESNDSAKKIRLENFESETEAKPLKTRGCSVKWSSAETNLLRRYFHNYIYINTDKDDNTGNLPCKKEIEAFLKSHSIGCIKELNEKTQIQKIRTKIFNERKTSRERGRNKLSEIKDTTQTVK